MLKFRNISFGTWLGVIMLVLWTPSASAQRMNRVSTHNNHGKEAVSEPLELWVVDEEPSFPGGEVALLRYINAERQYPDDAYKARISGRVLCHFIIEPDGSLSEIQVVRGVMPSIDKEAVRIISNMPRWEPAKIQNEAVPVNYILPIPFRL